MVMSGATNKFSSMLTKKLDVVAPLFKDIPERHSSVGEPMDTAEVSQYIHQNLI
jgi:hypothetical protein